MGKNTSNFYGEYVESNIFGNIQATVWRYYLSASPRAYYRYTLSTRFKARDGRRSYDRCLYVMDGKDICKAVRWAHNLMVEFYKSEERRKKPKKMW